MAKAKKTGSISSKQTAEVRFEYWALQDLWTVDQSVSLLLGLEPSADQAAVPSKSRESYVTLRTLITQAAGKSLKYFDREQRIGPRFFPWSVIEWARSERVSFPLALETAVMESHGSQFRTGTLIEIGRALKKEIAALNAELERIKEQSGRPYMDSDHSYFSDELEAAVSAWLAFYGNRKPGDDSGHHERLGSWLREHYQSDSTNRDGFSESAFDRIATLANARKQGGAPKGSRKHRPPEP